MTRHHTLRLAGSAIAAALVLGATPGFAQDAELPASPPITIVIPQPTVAPAPEPVSAAPVAEVETPAAAASAAPRAAAPLAPRARSAAVRPPANSAAPVTPAVVPEATAPELAVPAPIEAAPIAGPVAAPTDDSGDELLFGAGLAAALGLGALGLGLAARRRRRVRRAAMYEETAPVAVIPEPAPMPVAMPVAPRAATAPWTSPGAFAMPAVVPADEMARRALIERMVKAKPDAANPFKSRKARTRRARHILHERAANQRPPLEDRVVARAPAARLHRAFEDA
ncbi:MAG: hypothetical protein ACREBO_09690 [Novosphingobium sp.]